MCELCYKEYRNEADISATTRGAKRQKDIVMCRETHHLLERDRFDLIGLKFYCDSCRTDINYNEPRYTNYIEMHQINAHSIDYCRACSEAITEAGERVVDVTGLKYLERLPASKRCRMDVTGFGSILDWIPVIHHVDEYEYDKVYADVLLNMNPDSPLYGRIGLCAFYENMYVYYVLNQKLADNGVVLLQEMLFKSDKCEKKASDFDNSLSPLLAYMHQHKMNFNF